MEVIEGNMTAAKYRDEILRGAILPFQQACPAENFIFLDDNASRLQTSQRNHHWRLAGVFSRSERDRARLGYASEGSLCATTSPKQPGCAFCCCPRRVEPLGPEPAQTACAQRSKQVPWGDSSQRRLQPPLTWRTPLNLTICVSKWRQNGYSLSFRSCAKLHQAVCDLFFFLFFFLQTLFRMLNSCNVVNIFWFWIKRFVVKFCAQQDRK